MRKDIIFFIGFFIFAFLLAVGIIVLGQQKDNHLKRNAVCEYLHGKMHGDLCIRDNRVISTK